MRASDSASEHRRILLEVSRGKLVVDCQVVGEGAGGGCWGGRSAGGAVDVRGGREG